MSRSRATAGALLSAFAMLAVVAPAGADALHGAASSRLDNPFPSFQNAFSRGLAFAGDVDGDGYDELLVGACGAGRGKVAVYDGGPEGLDTLTQVLTSPSGSPRFGCSLGPLGDINADGYDDVGATSYEEAYVYYGSPAGLGEPVLVPPAPAEGPYKKIGSAGDVNADGYDDVLVGMPYWDGEFRNQGRIQLYLGSAEGLTPSPVEFSGAHQEGGRFGDSVAPAGDVDGDGYDDVLVGAPAWRDDGGPREGRLFVYLGSPDGLKRPGWHADPSDVAHAQFGAEIGPAGDVNGDGYDDVVAGDLPTDRIRVYLGSADGLRKPALTRSVTSDKTYDFGHAVAGAGDVDGDGLDDLVVGAPSSGADRRDEGRSFVFLGTRGGLARDPATVRDPADKKNVQYGDEVAGGGDVNGDGVPDIAVGAPEMIVETFRGRVYVYS